VEGRVCVNGELVGEAVTLIDPGRDLVEVDGAPVRPVGAIRSVALYKPVGVISAVGDPRGRPSVVDLVPSDGRLYPVGRLDYDSQGLLIMTNDGSLAHRLTHPRHSIEKEYIVTVSGPVTPVALDRIRGGILLDGSLTGPSRVEVIGRTGQRHELRVTLTEGRNRQVRRMVASIGLRTERLVRTRIGSLVLGALRPGEWRELLPAETVALRAAAS
jgi:pseudouridine synthase